jgi:hypothetical protein
VLNCVGTATTCIPEGRFLIPAQNAEEVAALD